MYVCVCVYAEHCVGSVVSANELIMISGMPGRHVVIQSVRRSADVRYAQSGTNTTCKITR